jgi:regulatory protein
MADTIEALDPVDGKSTVRVRIGGSSFEIGREAAETLGLAPGLVVGDGVRRAIEAAADRRVAAARVLRHLRSRPRTVHEVRVYLARHGHDEPTVKTLLAELQTQGLVDDARYAAWFVQARRQSRPTGTGRILRELLQHGVPRPLAEAAVQEAGDTRESELERALQAARPRLQATVRLGRERGMGRLHAFLLRRGFAAGVAREACLQLFADVPASPRDARSGRGAIGRTRRDPRRARFQDSNANSSLPNDPRGDVSPWSEPLTRSVPPI